MYRAPSVVLNAQAGDAGGRRGFVPYFCAKYGSIGPKQWRKDVEDADGDTALAAESSVTYISG